MITVQYSVYDKKVEHIEERLKEMSLAFQIKQVSILKEPVWEDSKVRLVGFEKIEQELNKLESELGQWWFCGC